MGWILLNASLSVSADTMPCDGGSVTATVTVTGKTDDKEEVNEYTASIRDDYVIPDILWDSGLKSVGANAEVEESYKVDLSCNGKCHVIGPDGDSGERKAELYAYVLSEELEGASDEVPVTCVK